MKVSKIPFKFRMIQKTLIWKFATTNPPTLKILGLVDALMEEKLN